MNEWKPMRKLLIPMTNTALYNLIYMIGKVTE